MNYFIQLLYKVYLFFKKIMFLNILYKEEKLFIDKLDLEILNNNEFKEEKLIDKPDLEDEKFFIDKPDLESLNNYDFKDEKFLVLMVYYTF